MISSTTMNSDWLGERDGRARIHLVSEDWLRSRPKLAHVAKDGKNRFSELSHTRALEALLAAIRGPLSARNVVLMPSLTALSEREYTTSNGKASSRPPPARAGSRWRTDRAARSTSAAGLVRGRPARQWGSAKAYTNAIKTFLREQFLIPHGG